jgi:dihydroorotate dehydrogenase
MCHLFAASRTAIKEFVRVYRVIRFAEAGLQARLKADLKVGLYEPNEMSFYTRVIRPALFALDAERAHNLTMAAIRQPAILRALQLTSPAPASGGLRQEVFGVTFDNPVGLAAGLDKHGTATAAWTALGFGFVEIGTVTPRPQPGNPQPRLFRLPADRAIINRFGFNSVGADDVARNLGTAGPSSRLRIGVNIGKNRETPNERAADDYVRAVEVLHPFAAYFVVNVSSPNTAGLRDLQESRMLRGLVERVVGRARDVVPGRTIPVLVKVSPDAAADDLLRSVNAALDGGAAGVIATNTTVTRAGLTTGEPLASQAGGLSGGPLREAANNACKLLFKAFGRRMPIIGVGGVFTADDAYERIRAGATLVQLYTGLIYEGPGAVTRIVRGLAERLERDGFTNVAAAVGADVR